MFYSSGMSSTGADEAMYPPVPDALDLVVEADAMLAVISAQRYVRVDALQREARAEAAAHGLVLTEVLERSVRLELAAALSLTEASAGALMSQADALVNRYPEVLDSLGSARMSQRHAVELIEAADTVEPELRPLILPRAIMLAEHNALGTFRRGLRTLVDSVRETTLPQRHTEALASRRVIVTPADDGMAWLMAFVPAVEAHAIHGRLTAMAKVLAAQEEDSRTLDQLRADVFGDILVDGVVDTLPAPARGIRATVVVTVPVLALLEGHGTATVSGVGPIPIDRARDLCGGSDGWMRVLTHPETGAVVSVGRERYRPPPELRRLVRWRADRCMAPGCSIPAERCEIDHTVAWVHGGTTSLENLAPLCKGHHTVKHHGRWKVEQVAGSGGALAWTSPAGRRYRVEPERRLPVFVPTASAGAPPF